MSFVECFVIWIDEPSAVTLATRVESHIGFLVQLVYSTARRCLLLCSTLSLLTTRRDVVLDVYDS
jgi:hypothetical protein